MRSMRLVLIAMLLALPFAVTANAQMDEGVGVGPAVAYAPEAYGPPVCDWGYYSYYPYACAPYGYYGPQWFYGGVFIGVGPWYGRGWGRGYGYGGYGRGGYAGGAARGYSGGGAARGGFSGGGGGRGGGGGGHGGGGHR